MLLGDGKTQYLTLALGKCAYHPHICTSHEPLFDLGCCLVTTNIQGQLPNFFGSACAKEDLECPYVPIGLRNPHQASGGTSSEVNRSWVVWLHALILFFSLIGCRENIPPLSASVSTCMFGPKIAESADRKGA